MTLIKPNLISDCNSLEIKNLDRKFNFLADIISEENIDIEELITCATDFQVAIPSWGVGTGGTRFARFPGVGEPQNVMDKLEDCSVINQLTDVTPNVSLHIPWDRWSDPLELKQLADSLGMGFDAMNSNTFQDQIDQKLSYKFGSLANICEDNRNQAVEHNIECIEYGKQIGSKALTVWIGDGSNFPGQLDFRRSFSNYLKSMEKIYEAMPNDWTLFSEHKLYEPAFYSTVLQDWGSSFLAAQHLGERAKCLVDLGHHAPTVNIELIVARLLQFGKLGGFHFNDSKYGDDDLDAGSIDPYRLFLVFNELVGFEEESEGVFSPAYMLDQSHNVTDPIESLIISAIEVQRAYIQSCLIDRDLLRAYQNENDALMAYETLKKAFRTDIDPILKMARFRAGAAIDPITVFRESEYRKNLERKRPQAFGSSSGIV